MAMYGSQNKWCFVPRCTNTSKSTPNKTFVRVPQEYERKKRWFKAARRNMPKSKSEFFCCEDHFKLEEDMENYVRFKLMGGKIIMKRDVVPHIFVCQPDRKRTATDGPTRSLPLKRERKFLVEEAQAAHEQLDAQHLALDTPSTSKFDKSQQSSQGSKQQPPQGSQQQQTQGSQQQQTQGSQQQPQGSRQQPQEVQQSTSQSLPPREQQSERHEEYQLVQKRNQQGQGHGQQSQGGGQPQGQGRGQPQGQGRGQPQGQGRGQSHGQGRGQPQGRGQQHRGRLGEQQLPPGFTPQQPQLPPGFTPQQKLPPGFIPKQAWRGQGPPGLVPQQAQTPSPGLISQPEQVRRGPLQQQNPSQDTRQQQVRSPQQEHISSQLPPQQKKAWGLSQPPSRDTTHSSLPVSLDPGLQSPRPSQPAEKVMSSLLSEKLQETKLPPKQGSSQEPPSKAKGSQLAIPIRKKTGTKGRRIDIETNYLLLKMGQLKPAVHYDVSFKQGERVVERPKKLLRAIMESFRQQNYRNRFPAYDGSKSLYSSSKLPFGDSITREVTIKDDDRDKTFQVAIKFAATVDLSSLNNYVASIGSGKTINIPQAAIHCLDIILRNAPSLRCYSVGQSFFTKPLHMMDLGEGMEMYHGYYQSAILGWKPFLNVDVAHKPFPKTLVVVDLIGELCTKIFRGMPQSVDLVNLHLHEGTENFRTVDKFLRTLKIRYEIPRNPSSKRLVRINSLYHHNSENAVFTDERGVNLSVADYYLKTKNYKLRYPKLNCLWVGSRQKKILYPPELCTLVEGQATNKAMTPNQTSKMIKLAATPTDERKRKIMASVTAANYNTDSCANEFGISVGNQFTQIQARVLNPPELQYNGRPTKVSRGVWRADKFLKGKSLTKWAILCVERRTQEPALYDFANKMIRQGKLVGMEIEQPCSVVSRQLKFRTEKQDLKSEFTKFKGMELVVVVIPEDKDTYAWVKQVAELHIGTLTQCVKSKNVYNAKDATVANILLKINAKLDGVNHTLARKPFCLSRPCMIMGADVTHPSPESKGTSPSVAAVTASHDPNAFQYNISWRLQPPTQEIISDLANIVKEHLTFFMKKNKVKPERIIFFRDGVSEGQFQEVLTSEVRAIRNACYLLENDATYQPKITFLVVQKRHHTRFFPKHKQDSEDRNGNVPAGTIVDTEITHPTYTDFYLVSHASIQGVARPTRYRKLWDDYDMDEDELEELTFHLCHLFTRCTRSVSYPAPTYYAHLAAARAKVYCEKINIDMNNLERTQRELIIKHEIVADKPMFFV